MTYEQYKEEFLRLRGIRDDEIHRAHVKFNQDCEALLRAFDNSYETCQQQPDELLMERGA